MTWNPNPQLTNCYLCISNTALLPNDRYIMNETREQIPFRNESEVIIVRVFRCEINQ